MALSAYPTPGEELLVLNEVESAAAYPAPVEEEISWLEGALELFLPTPVPHRPHMENKALRMKHFPFSHRNPVEFSCKVYLSFILLFTTACTLPPMKSQATTDTLPTPTTTPQPYPRTPTATLSPTDTQTPEATPYLVLEPNPTLDPNEWLFYPQAADLTRGQVVDIAQSPDGSMWFQAGVGLSRFHQNEWVAYPIREELSIERIYHFDFTSNGNMWVATKKGLFLFDGTTWKQYTACDDLIGKKITTLAISKNDVLWLGTDDNIYRYDGSQWTSFPYSFIGLSAGDYVTRIAPTSDGKTWFGTEKGSIISFDEKQWLVKTVGKAIAEMAVASDGSLWMVVFTKLLEGQTIDLMRIKGEELISYGHLPEYGYVITGLIVTKNDMVWVADYGGFGAAQFDGTQWSTIQGNPLEEDRPWPFTGKGIFSLFEDSEGSYWFGTAGGAYQYRPKK